MHGNQRENGMTRIRILKREDMNEEQGKVYDEIEAAG